MNNALLKKSALLVFTMTTASFYFSQETDKSKDIEEVVITSVADIAKDRKTPVAVSTIKEAAIVEKIGNQEFPEILNSTPSVYATKAGGGYGDSQIRVRGFDQRNTAVLINGVPVNDMENGAVYWSNWAGLSDVTSAMQVQRGLGSSKLAIASVGGTINVLTRAADKKRQGNVTIGIGNDGFHKALFSYNTGKQQNGLSASFLMSRAAGSMYADGTKFEGYNYYFALGYAPTKQHDLQFTITGAPQWHHQRSFANKLSDYIKYGQDGEPNRKYNSDWGYLNGQEFSMARNYYHKPVMSLNWDWKISPITKLSTVVYASFGRGGGTGDAGSAWTGEFNYDKTTGKYSPKTKNIYSLNKTKDGLINFDEIVRYNQGLGDGSALGVVADGTPYKAGEGRKVLNTADGKSYSIYEGFIRRASINSHNWFGAIMSLNHKISDHLNFTVGVDGRKYRGYHYRVASDLLGNNSYTDTANINNKPNVVSNVFEATPSWNPFGGSPNAMEDQIIYSNDGIVSWIGGFGQLEYTKDNLSAFVQGSLSNQGFERVDYFIYTPDKQKSEKVNQPGYNIKGGVNYNITRNHNLFANAGYYERQPFFGAVFLNNTNDVNPGLTNEKVASFEVGYGFRSSKVNANLNLYHTSWNDIYRRLSFRDATTNLAYQANLLGLNQVHKGIEFDITYRPLKIIGFDGMISVGDFKYKGNPSATFIDDQNNQNVGSTTLYLDGLKVGDAAQFTSSIGTDIYPTDWLKFDANFRYINNLYSRFEPTSRTSENGDPALKLPAYGLLDMGATLKWKLTDVHSLDFRLNVNNVLDKTYISEATTNKPENTDSTKNWNGVNVDNNVYFGFGRTWNASVSFKF